MRTAILLLIHCLEHKGTVIFAEETPNGQNPIIIIINT